MTKVTMPEPVAWIGNTFQLLWFGARTITKISEQTGAKVGDALITTTQAEAYADARVAESQQWQPIETAPKDGRTILLGYYNSHGNWRTMRGQWMSEDYIAEHWEDTDDEQPGWFETSVEADDIPNWWRIEPSHWMPLPAPPQQ